MLDTTIPEPIEVEPTMVETSLMKALEIILGIEEPVAETKTTLKKAAVAKTEESEIIQKARAFREQFEQLTGGE
mgnify:CR=1 FL=1